MQKESLLLSRSPGKVMGASDSVKSLAISFKIVGALVIGLSRYIRRNLQAWELGSL